MKDIVRFSNIYKSHGRSAHARSGLSPRSPNLLGFLGHFEQPRRGAVNGLVRWRGESGGRRRRRRQRQRVTGPDGFRHRRSWRRVWVGHLDHQRRHFVHFVETMAQMGHQFSAQLDVNTRNGSQASGNFIGAVGVTSPETISIDYRVGGKSLLTTQFIQMTDGEFQYVSLFQLADIFTLTLERRDHNFLELVETTIDPCPSFSLQHGLHHLPVLVGSGDGLGFFNRQHFVRHFRHKTKHLGKLHTLYGVRTTQALGCEWRAQVEGTGFYRGPRCVLVASPSQRIVGMSEASPFPHLGHLWQYSACSCRCAVSLPMLSFHLQRRLPQSTVSLGLVPVVSLPLAAADDIVSFFLVARAWCVHRHVLDCPCGRLLLMHGLSRSSVLFGVLARIWALLRSILLPESAIMFLFV